MLYHLLPPLSDVHVVFNVFVYITFRAAGAMVTALLIAFAFGPPVIRRLEAARVGQVVRDVGPASHLVKAGTPTMGGLIIIASATLSTLLWAELSNWYVILAVVSLLWMGAIGFLDDYLKVVQGKSRGLIGRYKMVGQWTFGLGLGAFLLWNPISPHPSTWTTVPFFSDVAAAVLAPVFVLFTGAVVSLERGEPHGRSRRAGGGAHGHRGRDLRCVRLRRGTRRHVGLSRLLLSAGGRGADDLRGCARRGGRGLPLVQRAPRPGLHGRHRLPRARGRHRGDGDPAFLLVIVGGVFVLETVSVILQTSWFKYTRARYGEGRRIFRMAPIHHHFEQLGWPETKVVIRFWILGILFAMVAISTLKIR